MDFQVVVLAGGTSKKLVPLVSKEVPKALLPVANRPVLSYVLELLEQSNLKDLIVVVEGQEAAVLVSGWISSAYLDRLHVEVAAVSEDVGTADALRAISHHLTASDILVVSGDLVCDVPPGAVAAVHRRHDAVVTMLCSAPVSGPAESGSSGGKDKVKKPARCDIIGLDSTKQFLLHIASGIDVEKDVRVQKSILRAVGQTEVLTDLMDAHLYAFKRSVLQEVLDQKERFQSLKHDVLPYLVRTQLASLKKIALDSQFPETCSINNIICQMVEEEDRTLVEIVEEDTPIDIIKYIDYVRAPQCGAITTFSGTTRDTFDNKKVMELRYEAYVPMAIRCLKSICASARSTWSLNSMAVAHKLGPVPVGETSVFIAISSVHRADALDACKFLIDELKATVPIWKKEVYENGEVWKENTEFLGRRTDLGKAITEEKEEDAHHKKGCCGVKIRVDDGL